MTEAAAKSRLTRNTLWSVASYGLQFIVPILLIPYIVSRVTKEVYGGLWVTLFTLTSWLSYFDLGIWGGLTREVAERQARQDRDGLKSLWATWLVFDVAVGSLLLLATGLAGGEILRRYVPQANPVSDGPLLLGLAAQFVLAPLMRHLTCTLTGLQRLDLSSRLTLVVTPLWTAGQVFALEGGWGLRGLMVNGLVFSVVQIVVLVVLVGRQGYPMTMSPARFSAADLRRLLGFGWKLQAGSVVNQAFRSDRLVMSAMQSSGAAIAFYQFGAGVMDRLAGAVGVLSSGILSAVTDLAARGDRDRVRVVFLRGTKYHALAGFGLLGFAALFGNELMMFWMGESLPQSVRVLRIMFLGGLATAIGSCGQSVAVALGRPGLPALCSTLGLAATVFLYMIGGRRYDTDGLAASVSLGLALIQIAFMIGLRGFLEFRWGEYVGNALLKPAVLAVPLAGVYAGWSALAPHLPAVNTRFRAFLALAPAFLLSAALGWAMARAFRVVDEYDLDVLKSPGAARIRMNILYLSDILNVHDERLLSQFRAAGHTVTLLTFFHRAPELPKFVLEMGLNIIHEKYQTYPDGAGASRWRLIRAVEYRRDEARACLKIKEVMRRNRFDVVFANWALTSGYVAAHALAKPLCLFPWGSDILVWPKLHRGFAERATKALRTADLVVCNSKTAAEEAKRLARLRPDAVEVLPIELDGGKFEPRPRNDALRAQWGIADKTVIISTRPLKEMYDHPTLLAALAKPGMENFAVALVGEGNLRADLEKRANDLKVADRVKFVGMVDNEKIPDHLAAGDIYVTCSRSDSASLGLLEAMASGLPVVASDIPANREWIADGQSGWVFPGGNSEALSKVLLKAVESEPTRQEVALRGRAIALARADARKNFPRLLARIEALAKMPKAQAH